jgi:hypothetical protein
MRIFGVASLPGAMVAVNGHVLELRWTCLPARASPPRSARKPAARLLECDHSMLTAHVTGADHGRRISQRAIQDPSRVPRSYSAAHHHHPISSLPLSFLRRRLFNMSFARTLLRTSRALRQQSTNPIQPALGARGQTQFVNSSRSYATAFERSKPHVNIGTIGHVDHGKVRFSLRLSPINRHHPTRPHH